MKMSVQPVKARTSPQARTVPSRVRVEVVPTVTTGLPSALAARMAAAVASLTSMYSRCMACWRMSAQRTGLKVP